MTLPIMFETDYELYLAVPVPGLPLYILYEQQAPGRWEPLRNFNNGMTGIMRDRAGTLDYMRRVVGSCGLRKVSRLEALIKYGFVTE